VLVLNVKFALIIHQNNRVTNKCIYSEFIIFHTHHWIGSHFDVLGHVHHIEGHSCHALGMILAVVGQSGNGHVLIANCFNLKAQTCQ